MNKTYTNCFLRSRRSGLTLIEVVAAIAILGTILVGVVLARSRHSRQLAQSRQQARAVRVADEQIAEWWSGPMGIPVDRRGVSTEDDSYEWETRIVRNPAVEKLGARIVRVSIYERDSESEQPRVRGEPVVFVDLVLPAPEKKERTP